MFKMAGTIGLTATGQELDRYVTAMTDRKAAHRIMRFTEKLTNRLHLIRSFDDEFTLGLYRKYYKAQVEDRFGSLDLYPKALLLGYVHTLTNPQFVPTTRTQQSLMRKPITENAPWFSFMKLFGVSG
jgi:hypothetical protein